jgi:hypothetical protein
LGDCLAGGWLLQGFLHRELTVGDVRQGWEGGVQWETLDLAVVRHQFFELAHHILLPFPRGFSISIYGDHKLSGKPWLGISLHILPAISNISTLTKGSLKKAS